MFSKNNIKIYNIFKSYERFDNIMFYKENNLK